MESSLMGTAFQFGNIEISGKKWIVVITAQQGKCTNATEMYT